MTVRRQVRATRIRLTSFVKICVGRKGGGRPNTQSCGGQTVAAIVGGMRRARGHSDKERTKHDRRSRPCARQTVVGAGLHEVHEVNLHSRDYEVAVAMSPPKIAAEVAMLARGLTLHEAVEKGAREQWERDVGCRLDVVTVA